MKRNILKRFSGVKVLSVLLIIVVLGNLFYCRDAFVAGAEGESAPSRDEQIENAYYPTDYSGYRYAVLPGTSLWPYDNHATMVELCQVPNEVLQLMSTEDLLQTVLAYPLMLDVYAYDDNSVGYDNQLEKI